MRKTRYQKKCELAAKEWEESLQQIVLKHAVPWGGIRRAYFKLLKEDWQEKYLQNILQEGVLL